MHLELVIQMFSQIFFTVSFLEQQSKVGKTIKFIMGNDMEELLNFTIALCFHNSWIFIQPPLGPLRIKSEILFFYIEYAWLMFSFYVGYVLCYNGHGLFGLGFNTVVEICCQKLKT